MGNAEFVLSVEPDNADAQRGQKGRRKRTALLAAGLTLAGAILAGCSDGGGTEEPKPSGSTMPSSGSTGSSSPSETLSPSPTNTSYPVGARGCVENGSWTRSQEVSWLTGLVEYGSASQDFTIAQATEKYANSAAVCEPVEATAIFWHTESDQPIELYPGEYSTVTIDGSKEVTINNNAPSDAPIGAIPPTLYSCEGSARALYVGWDEVGSDDIPKTVPVTAGSGSLYASQFKEASDRAVDGTLSCYGADPSRDYYWPTPGYSYGVPTPDYSYGIPTPGYSFDWNSLGSTAG